MNTELSKLTDDLYRSQNCVLAHPTRQKFPRLMQLYREYPSVGLIIITGPGKDENDFQSMETDADGLNFLPKPFTMSELFGAIEKVTCHAKGLTKKLC